MLLLTSYFIFPNSKSQIFFLLLFPVNLKFQFIFLSMIYCVKYVVRCETDIQVSLLFFYISMYLFHSHYLKICYLIFNLCSFSKLIGLKYQSPFLYYNVQYHSSARTFQELDQYNVTVSG